MVEVISIKIDTMVFSERKPKFRARKLDFAKTLQVYRFDQAVDLDDYGSPLRTVAQVATGVDKDEEDEHHLKAALSAATSQTQTYYIPTPEAHPSPADFDILYPKKYKHPKQFIKWSGKTLEELTADMSRYDADIKDAEFATGKSVSLELFEWIIEAFEDCAHKLSQNAVSLEVLERFRADSKTSSMMPKDEICEEILRYWSDKRTRLSRPLLTYLRHEDLSAKIGADPYVCFRRREIKAPRKTRRTDAQCMEKLKKLHYDLCTTKALLDASLKRDRYKKESLILETSLFESYWSLESWKRLPDRSEEWNIPDVPSFRAAAQSVLEPKKKKSRPQSSESAANSAPIPPVRIPISSHQLLKSTKYFKPYYPIEVLKQIQKDMEMIMVDEASRIEDRTADLSDDSDQASFTDSREEMSRVGLGVPCFSRFRLGRSGMIQIDRKPIRSAAESRPRMDYNGSSRVKLLNARDCSHLHNAFVGNYNQHYIQTTNHINQPLSFNAWIAATAPIVTAATAGNSKSNSKSNLTSPKNSKKKDSDSLAADSSVPDASTKDSSQPNQGGLDQQINSQHSTPFSQPTNSQIQAGLAGLTGNSQITVKVKSKPNP